MAINSWSNPSPQQGISAAEATRGTQINPINIAGLVSSIIEQKHRQQQQQQQAIGQILNSVGSIYQQGQANDAANMAQYQARYPGDTTDPGTPGYSDRVPDYGGTQGLQSYKIAQQLQDEQARRGNAAWEMQNKKDLAPLNAELLRSRINDTDAQANYRQRHVTNSTSQDRELRIEAQAQLDAAKRSYAGEVGVLPQNLSKIEDALNSYHEGQPKEQGGVFPALGSHAAIEDASQGEYKDRVLSARSQYKAALDRLNNLNSTPQQGQGDLRSQAQQAIQSGASEQAVRDRYKQLTGQDL